MLFEQRLKLRQLAEWCEVRVLLDVLEVVVAGDDRFFQAGQREVEPLLTLGLLGLGGLRIGPFPECGGSTPPSIRLE